MGSRSVSDDVMLCAEVLGRFGVSAEAVCRGVDAERPEDAIAAALERAPSRTEFLKRAISTGPRGIDCPARYARETPWSALADLFEALGWSFDAEDRSGRPVAATRNPAGPFSVTVADTEGRRRTATVEYPDTPLGRYNLPGLLAHVERRLLYGFDWRFVALSDGADRWRFALVETDDLTDLRGTHGDRIEPFGRPLLARHAPVAYGPDADPTVFPDWATDAEGRDGAADAERWPDTTDDEGDDPGRDDPADPDDTDDLIEFVGQAGRRDSISDDAASVDDDAAATANPDGGATVERDPGGFGGAEREVLSGGAEPATDDDSADDEDEGAPDDGTWSDGFDDLSGWSTPEESSDDGDDAGEEGETATDAGDARAHGDDVDGFSLSGSPTTVRSSDEDAVAADDEPSGPTAAETFTAAAGTVDGTTSVGDTTGASAPSDSLDAADDGDAAAASDDGGEANDDGGEANDDGDDFFDGGLAGGPDVSRVENDSFGLPESQTDDERLQAAGAAIDAGGGVSVKGLLDDDSFLPTIPAEGPTEVRVSFDATFDPAAPSPAETQQSEAEDGFVWVNADRLGSEP